MSRPIKPAVCEYFPHYCKHGKSLFIIEQNFGNDGYSMVFKLFEILGSTEDHYIDINIPGMWEYIVARSLMNEEKVEEILDLFSKIGTIDSDLWNNYGVIYSVNFVNNLQPLYERRKVIVKTIDEIRCLCIHNTTKPIVIADNCNNNATLIPQRKVKESKEKESKEKGMESGGNIIDYNNDDDVLPVVNDSVPYKEIVEHWNNLYSSTFGKIVMLSEKRKRSIRVLFKNFVRIEQMYDLFKKASESSFLRGMNSRSWMASFDWIINPVNSAKILSGNYDDPVKRAGVVDDGWLN